MKAARLSDAQNAFILKWGENGLPVAEICRKAGIARCAPRGLSGGLTLGARVGRRGPQDV